MRCAVWPTVALAALLALCTGCKEQAQEESATEKAPATQKAPAASETPEAAFAAFQEAAKKNDWKTVAESLTPESQESLAAAMIFASSFLGAFDEAKGKELEQLLKKHGLDPDAAEGPDEEEAASLEEAMKQIVAPVKDKPAFIAEMIAWLEKNAEGESFADQIASGKLSDVSIQGDTATGTVTDDDGKPSPIEFRRSNGRWLIHMPEEETGMGPAIHDESEWGPPGEFDDFGDDFSFGMFEESDPMPPVEAVSIDDFNSAWQTSLDVSDRPAVEALGELAEECGLKLQAQDDVAEALSRPVTLKLEAVSRLEAIEEIARQVGVCPRYGLRKLGFRPGPRPLPAVFTGPFLVEVTRMEEHVPYAAGSVELRFIAAGIPAPAIARIKGLMASSDSESEGALTLRLQEVTGTGGQDVLHGQPGGMEPQATLTLVAFTRTVELKNLVRSVTEIERLSGELSFALPTKMTTLVFADVKEDATASADGITMKIGSAELDETSSIQIEYEGTEYDQVTVVPLGADGEALEVVGSGGGGFDKKGSVSVFVEGRPASIEARVIQETHRVRLPFELGTIPLESHDEMPEAVDPLKFEGDVPISVEFVKFQGSGDSKRIVLRIKNHSNKDLSSVHLQLDYHDASGKKLDDSPHGHSGGRGFLAAGDSEEIEVSTFFMPDDTDSVQVDVVSASFADATEWERPR